MGNESLYNGKQSGNSMGENVKRGKIKIKGRTKTEKNMETGSALLGHCHCRAEVLYVTSVIYVIALLLPSLFHTLVPNVNKRAKEDFNNLKSVRYYTHPVECKL